MKALISLSAQNVSKKTTHLIVAAHVLCNVSLCAFVSLCLMLSASAKTQNTSAFADSALGGILMLSNAWQQSIAASSQNQSPSAAPATATPSDDPTTYAGSAGNASMMILLTDTLYYGADTTTDYYGAITSIFNASQSIKLNFYGQMLLASVKREVTVNLANSQYRITVSPNRQLFVLLSANGVTVTSSGNLSDLSQYLTQDDIMGLSITTGAIDTSTFQVSNYSSSTLQSVISAGNTAVAALQSAQQVLLLPEDQTMPPTQVTKSTPRSQTGMVLASINTNRLMSFRGPSVSTYIHQVGNMTGTIKGPLIPGGSAPIGYHIDQWTPLVKPAPPAGYTKIASAPSVVPFSTSYGGYTISGVVSTTVETWQKKSAGGGGGKKSARPQLI